MNRAVARFADGHVEKGMTLDFAPGKERFHLASVTLDESASALLIRTMDLKALFFVKDLAGDPLHVDKQEFDSMPPRETRPIRAHFRDGEVMVGTTSAYHPGVSGFFIEPADPESNNVRAYVITSATDNIRMI